MIKLTDVYQEIFRKISRLPYNVYDEVPQEPSNPHIRIDYSYNTDKSGKNYDGIAYYQYIHVFSTYKGRKEILKMTDDVVEALSDNIETEDFIAYPYVERNEILVESDNYGGTVRGYNINGTYRHAIIKIRYIIYKK